MSRAYPPASQIHPPLHRRPLSAPVMQKFLEALDTGRTPECCARDHIRTLALMLAAYESNETGQAVAFADRWE